MATTNGGLEENQTSRLDSTDNSRTLSEVENSGSCSDNLPPPTSANNVAGGNESEQETKEDNIVNDGRSFCLPVFDKKKLCKGVLVS